MLGDNAAKSYIDHVGVEQWYCKKCYQKQIEDIVEDDDKKVKRGTLEVDIEDRTFDGKPLEAIVQEPEYCEHGNLVLLGCQLCDPSRLERKRSSGEDSYEFTDERCDLCDAPCARKVGNSTWRCAICNQRSTNSGSPAYVDFRRFGTNIGRRGRSKLQIEVNKYRNNFWHKIPRGRRQEIISAPAALSGDYLERMLPFLRFERGFEL
jgi:hypothetical protein